MKLNLNFFREAHDVECRTDWRDQNLTLDVNGVEVVTIDGYEYSRDTFKQFAIDHFVKRFPQYFVFGSPEIVERPENAEPFPYLHNDFTNEFEVLNLDKTGLLEKIGYKRGDWIMSNAMWYNRGPKHTNMPFVVADMATLKRVDLDNVWKSFEHEYHDLKNYHVVNPIYREGIDWYVFDDLEPNEFLLFRHFDKYKTVYSTLHGAPSAPLEGRPDRVSADIRVFCMEKL